MAAEPVIPDFGEASDCVTENRLFCTDWVRENWDPVLQPALVEHIKLTVIAVGVGFAISLAAALLAHRFRHVERPIAFVSAVIYTIPSLALFQLLVPVTGLTVTTVEIALVGYTLLILFRNNLAGLRSAPPEVLEAARGMGLTPNQTLWRVELPLALPAIVAGLRIAVVSTIALATVAAFVVSQGLGGPILGALRLDFRTEIIAAGALAVGLAILADALLVLAQRAVTPWAYGQDGDVIAALDVFVDSLAVHRRRARLLILEKTLEHLVLSARGARSSRSRSRCRSASCSATCHRGSFVGGQPGQRRPGAADARRDRGRLHLPRDRLHDGACSRSSCSPCRRS